MRKIAYFALSADAGVTAAAFDAGVHPTIIGGYENMTACAQRIAGNSGKQRD